MSKNNKTNKNLSAKVNKDLTEKLKNAYTASDMLFFDGNPPIVLIEGKKDEASTYILSSFEAIKNLVNAKADWAEGESQKPTTTTKE